MNTEQTIQASAIPLVLSVQDLARVLQIGRNRAYALVNSGSIRVVRIGKHIRIPQSALMEYLNDPGGDV